MYIVGTVQTFMIWFEASIKIDSIKSTQFRRVQKEYFDMLAARNEQNKYPLLITESVDSKLQSFLRRVRKEYQS